MKLSLSRFLVSSMILAAVTCNASERMVDGRGIGDLIIGQALPTLTPDRLLSRQWQSDENGERYELVRVAVKSVPVDVEVHDGRIWRISVERRGLSTRDGSQVGDSIQKLIHTNRLLRREIGPGPNLVLVPENICGISYVTDDDLPESLMQATPIEFPIEFVKSTLIRRIFVVGCKK